MRVGEFAELLELIQAFGTGVALSGQTKRDWLWSGKRDGR